MPFKSRAQRRKFAELLVQEKISNTTFWRAAPATCEDAAFAGAGVTLQGLALPRDCAGEGRLFTFTGSPTTARVPKE